MFAQGIGSPSNRRKRSLERPTRTLCEVCAIEQSWQLFWAAAYADPKSLRLRFSICSSATAGGASSIFRQAWQSANCPDAPLGEGNDRRMDLGCFVVRGQDLSLSSPRRSCSDGRDEREGSLAAIERLRKSCRSSGHRASRPPAHLRKTLPGGRRGTGTDPDAARPRISPNHGTLSGYKAGSGTRT